MSRTVISSVDRVVEPEPGYIFPNRLVPVELPLIDKRRQGQGRERLSHRAEREGRISRDRLFPGNAPHSVTLRKCGLSIRYDTDGHTRNLKLLHGALDELIYAVKGQQQCNEQNHAVYWSISA
jgi:hypothetical protein